jgi:hypothetical protein
MGPAHHGEAPASCPVLGLSESVSKRDRGAFSSPSLLTLLRQCLASVTWPSGFPTSGLILSIFHPELLLQ